MKNFLLGMLLLLVLPVLAQHRFALPADKWVDSVFNTLSNDQKIAQLIIVRLSSIDPASRKITFYDSLVEDNIRRYNIGGICLFQGGPIKQAMDVNRFQAITKTPMLICIDAENGVGMRMDSIAGLPRQMMLGAVQDPMLIYQYGRLVGEQCKRLGIQVNFAPVVDVNNNPDNPVINDRSFGEDKIRVASDGLQYMHGIQDAGVMACAKHFPGHGDVSVDSHVDLPTITKSMRQLDTLELYPFKALIKSGVGGVMVGHLFVPAIDNTPNQASSLSYKTVTKLLRKKLRFNGLIFTDALEMKGVTKYYPEDQASVQSLIAGNDLLCLPGDVAVSIAKIKAAIEHRKIKWKEVDARVKKVLYAKYAYGLASQAPVILDHLTEDVNRGVSELQRDIARESLTLLAIHDTTVFPLRINSKKKIAYLGLGLLGDNEFAQRMRSDYNAHVYYFDYRMDSIKAGAVLELLKDRYDLVVIGLHNYARYPANNFNISKPALWLMQQIQAQTKTITFVFGNPYAIKNTCGAANLIACYDDEEITGSVAADLLNGKFTAKGKLPVSVCASFQAGDGIVDATKLLPTVSPDLAGFNLHGLLPIDSICREAIAKRATPGCVVLVAKDGNVVYNKAFGNLSFDKAEPVYTETIYDLASVTKICATSMAVMKLYEQGKLDLQKTLGDYLWWVKGTDKDTLKLYDLLLHRAGLRDFIPFYQETLEKNKEAGPIMGIYSWKPDGLHSVKVAENLYLRRDWEDTMYRRIVQSKLGPWGKYVYSDNDFIFMGKVVEAITGMSLDQYVKKIFYDPLGMKTTGFKPRERFPIDRIAPTEPELVFRKQLLRGNVHDPGAAMFGGVAGHAGLFSDAYDLAVLEQMLLNGGLLNGQQFLKKETVDFFTSYHSDNSRRGLGFDKPEKDNATRKEPYPCLSASPQTFGHTGFTGICVWSDPTYHLIFIFLSNRVNSPADSQKLSSMAVRSNIMEMIYKAMNVHAPYNP